MQHFAGRLQPVLRGHVRIEEPIVLAVNMAFERRSSVRKVVRHRNVGKVRLFRVAANDQRYGLIKKQNAFSM